MFEQSIGRRIAKLRLERGLTQEQLAREIGVSAQAVSKWENDQNYPDISLLVPLSRILGTSVDELLGAEPTETSDKTAAADKADTKDRATTGTAHDVVASNPAIDHDSSDSRDAVCEKCEAANDEMPIEAHAEVLEASTDDAGAQSHAGETPSQTGRQGRKLFSKPKMLHVLVQEDGESSDVHVNIPLAFARSFLSHGIVHIAELDGIDLGGILESANFDEAGTIVDLADEGDHVRIWID